jgi:pimeloyl-ACP methyl ester carboxylesterase
MQEKEITHKGKRIFYRTIGEGPVVVLLHGVPFDGHLWSNQFSAFENYKLIIPDLPGSGRSELVEDMSMEGMAECIQELIVHETASLFFKSGEPHSVVVIGHSMGGYITLALAEKYPELLNGIGFFHSTAYADSEERKQGRKKTIALVREKGVSEFVDTSFPNLYSPETRQKKPELIKEEIERAYNFSAETIVSYQTAMMQRPDRTGILRKSRIPVLFILGKYDGAVPLKDGLEQCSLADLNYIHILENSGHVGMKEEPVESTSILLNYLTNTCHQTR